MECFSRQSATYRQSVRVVELLLVFVNEPHTQYGCYLVRDIEWLLGVP